MRRRLPRATRRALALIAVAAAALFAALVTSRSPCPEWQFAFEEPCSRTIALTPQLAAATALFVLSLGLALRATRRGAVRSLLLVIVLAVAAAPAAAAPGDTMLVNRSMMGDGDAWGSAAGRSISGDGRYVLFETDDERYYRYDDNLQKDVFLRDVVAGTTTLVSRRELSWIGDHGSGGGVISQDGEWVAFLSKASNLTDSAMAEDDDHATDLFLWHRPSGDITQINRDVNGLWVHDPAGPVTISADGSRVLYRTVSGSIYTYDRADDSGRVLVARGYEHRECDMPSLSADGSRAAYICDPDPDGGPHDLLVRDIASGTETVVEGDGVWIRSPSLSADGRLVVWSTQSTGHVAEDTTPDFDVVMRDLATGATELISRDVPGVDVGGGFWGGAISADARYVGFIANPRPDGGCCETGVVYDRQTGGYEVASRADGAGGRIARAAPGLFGVSADGRFAFFNSTDPELDDQARGDGETTAYVRELGAAATPPPPGGGVPTPTEPPPGGAPATPAGGTGSDGRSNLVGLPSSARIGKRRHVALTVRNLSADRLTGRVTIRRWVSRRFTVAPSGRTTVRLRVGRRLARIVRRRGPVTVTLRATLRDGAGAVHRASSRLILR